MIALTEEKVREFRSKYLEVKAESVYVDDPALREQRKRWIDNIGDPMLGRISRTPFRHIIEDLL